MGGGHFGGGHMGTVIWAAIIGQVAAAATGAAAAIRTLLMEAVEAGTAITEIRMAYGGAYAYGYGYGNCAWLRRQAADHQQPLLVEPLLLLHLLTA
jgi:hypothetical protein